MGNEFSCPCSNSFISEKNNSKPEKDILKEIMKGKITKDDLLYEFQYSTELITTKICLVSAEKIEGFFKNRNLLIIETKYGLNLYYNQIFISNFLIHEQLACVILQYKKFGSKKNEIDFDDKEETIKSMTMRSINSKNSARTKNKYFLSNDYEAIYKIESLNFVGKEINDKKEQMLNDLYMQLKKEYILFGIISDGKNNNDLNNSTNIYYKNYKIIYKKSKISDDLDIKYNIEILENRLTRENITEILMKNKNKKLKSVIKEYNHNDSNFQYVYFFIFESNILIKEFNEDEILVVKISKNNDTPDSFLKDIGKKITMEDKAELLAVINDDDGFFLTFKLNMGNDDEESFE